MILSIIVAIAKDGTIGNKGVLPWRMPKDLKRFKNLTMGCPIIMGRKTFDSLPGILPARPHIVISRNEANNKEVSWSKTISEAIEQAKSITDGEVFVIGGAEIYKQILPYCNKIYLTKINASINGDTKLSLNINDEWKKIFQENSSDAKDQYPSEFIIYERVTG